jgi:hypothetical protein
MKRYHCSTAEHYVVNHKEKIMRKTLAIIVIVSILIYFAMAALADKVLHAEDYKFYNVVTEADIAVYEKMSFSSKMIFGIPKGATGEILLPVSGPLDGDQWVYVVYEGRGGFTHGTSTLLSSGLRTVTVKR